MSETVLHSELGMEDFNTGLLYVKQSETLEYLHTDLLYLNQHSQRAEYTCLKQVTSSQQKQVKLDDCYFGHKF